MPRPFCLALLAAGLALPTAARAPDDDSPAKEALQALNDYIGSWKGAGGPDRPGRPAPGETWGETLDWGWRFKGADAWIAFTVKDGKYLDSGEIRYLPDRSVYQLTVTDKKKAKAVYEGKLQRGYLTFERTDPATGTAQQLRMNLAGAYGGRPRFLNVFDR